VHIEGMSKTKTAGSGSSSKHSVGSDHISIGGHAAGGAGGAGTPGPRTDENPAVPTSAGSGSTYVGSQLKGGQRPGYLRLGGF